MAVEFKVEHTRTSEYLIPPRNIDIRPELNGRDEATDVSDLIESFVSVGQLTPVDVGNNGGRPYLIFGHRRWRAAVEGIKSGQLPKDFRLRCVYFKGTALDEFKAVIAENLERKSTTPTCDAQNIAKLERFGMTHPEIAKFYRQMMWQHVQRATSHSWLKLNRAMDRTMMLAVKAGFKFADHDLSLMFKRFRAGYWVGDLEYFYRTAVLYRNSTAYHAFETWAGRKPFIVKDSSIHVNTGDGPAGNGLVRLVVGAQFQWKGERVTVTSFNDRNGTVLACTYKPRTAPKACKKCHQQDWSTASRGPVKIAKRFTISHKDLSAAREVREF